MFDLGIYSYDIFRLGIFLVTSETQCASHLFLSCGYQVVITLESGKHALCNCYSHSDDGCYVIAYKLDVGGGGACHSLPM
jgi:hypothetical protein